jgi:transcriptional regulator with XRE-family HTH domain
MASAEAFSTHEVAKGKYRGLARLRKSAGYRSANEFAQSMGIPPTTYARYERNSGGPDSGIPLKSAWRIADKLNVTIDEVVGRGESGVVERDLNAFYESLSESGRTMLDEYVQYLSFREHILAAEGR